MTKNPLQEFKPAPPSEFAYFAEVLRRALVSIESHSGRANYGAIRLGGFFAEELQYIPQLLWNWPSDYSAEYNPMRENISRIPTTLQELDAPEELIEEARHVFLLEAGTAMDVPEISLSPSIAPATNLWKYVDITVDSLLIMRSARNVGLPRLPIQGSAFGTPPIRKSALREVGRTNVLLTRLIFDIPLVYSDWPSFSEDAFNSRLIRLLRHLPSHFSRFTE